MTTQPRRVTPSETIQLIIADIKSGTIPSKDIAVKHGVNRKVVEYFAKKEALPLKVRAKRKSRITPEMEAAILKDREAGLSWRAIGERHNMDESGILRYFSKKPNTDLDAMPKRMSIIGREEAKEIADFAERRGIIAASVRYDINILTIKRAFALYGLEVEMPSIRLNLTEKQIAQMCKMKSAGFSLQHIAVDFRCSTSTVSLYTHDTPSPTVADLVKRSNELHKTHPYTSDKMRFGAYLFKRGKATFWAYLD